MLATVAFVIWVWSFIGLYITSNIVDPGWFIVVVFILYMASFMYWLVHMKELMEYIQRR